MIVNHKDGIRRVSFRRSSCLILVMSALALICSAAAQESQHVIVVVGASGTQEYGTQFEQWADRWEAAARQGEATFELFAGNGESSDREALKERLATTSIVKTSEPLWLVLIGHGTFDGRTARFNLQGPDITAAELKESLQDSARPLAIINCASCSSPFVNALGGPDRTVVSSTKDGGEIQFARFGDFLSQAVSNLEADIDRDGQTSLLEAWLFASRKTAEFYESEGRLATEHALLDDSGDGKGTRSEVFEGTRIKDSVSNRDELDGRLAARWHLVRSDGEKRLTPSQRQKRDALEDQLEILRTKKKDLAESEYLRQLETILLPLAQIYESADTNGANPPRKVN